MSAAHLMHLDSPPIAKYKIWLDLNRLKAQGCTTVIFAFGDDDRREYDIDKLADMLECGLDHERYDKLCRHLEDSLQLLRRHAIAR